MAHWDIPHIITPLVNDVAEIQEALPLTEMNATNPLFLVGKSSRRHSTKVSPNEA